MCERDSYKCLRNWLNWSYNACSNNRSIMKCSMSWMWRCEDMCIERCILIKPVAHTVSQEWKMVMCCYRELWKIQETSGAIKRSCCYYPKVNYFCLYNRIKIVFDKQTSNPYYCYNNFIVIDRGVGGWVGVVTWGLNHCSPDYWPTALTNYIYITPQQF